MKLRTSRRLAAGAVASALICALAAAPPADASGGTFTQILCANPDTNQGVMDTGGQFPAGMTLWTDQLAMTRLEENASCDRGAMNTGRGVLLQTTARFSTNQPDSGGAISYRAPSEVLFRGATLYRAIALAPSNWATSIQSADHLALFGSPHFDVCEWWSGCSGRGEGSMWADGNRVEVSGTGKIPGFNITLKCNVAGPAFWCNSDGTQRVRLFGGKAHLEDPTNPAIGGMPSGELLDDSVLKGPESVTFNATDNGSGVYRAVVLVDGRPRLTQLVDRNNGRCSDVNPGNGDDYEFAYGRPCKTSAGGTFTFDTTQLPEGTSTVAIAVEDAAGNHTVMRSRKVEVDNVPAPTMVAAPQVAGSARRGSGLALQAGSWDDYGLAGDPAVAHRWQRCARDGSACADIAGATGATYVLTSEDVGRRVRVVETATNSQGAAQAVSELTAVVTREDGTLPPDQDGVDNDGDGDVDEPGEQAGSTDGPSGAGNTRPPAASGPATPVVAGGSPPSTSTSSSSAESAAGVNGEGASERARLTVSFAGRTGAAYTTTHGRQVEVAGRLVDEHGRPIRHAVVEAAEQARARGAAVRPGQPVLTRSDGGFTYRVDSRRGGQSLRFAYRYRRDGSVVSEGGLVLNVRAAVSLRVALKGAVVSYRGKVLGRPLPRRGKVVIVQGRAAGGRWQTFASRRASRSGAFSGRYRLKIRRPGARLQFRARAVAEDGWPYTAGMSRAVTRKVR